jgi:hypothetical protein
MTLFHYLHGNFQLTGWGVFWGLVLLGSIGGVSAVR